MHKNALIAGLTATTVVMVLAYESKSRTTAKLLEDKDQRIQWYKLRYSITTEELNFAYKRMNPWERSLLKELFDKNQEFVDVIGKAAHPNLH